MRELILEWEEVGNLSSPCSLSSHIDPNYVYLISDEGQTYHRLNACVCEILTFEGQEREAGRALGKMEQGHEEENGQSSKLIRWWPMPESIRTPVCGLGSNVTCDQEKVCHTQASGQCEGQELNRRVQPNEASRDAAFGEKLPYKQYCHLLPVVAAEFHEGSAAHQPFQSLNVRGNSQSCSASDSDYMGLCFLTVLCGLSRCHSQICPATL